MPTVSILVPIYGVEKYIEQCAETLFQQSFADIEYMFVNDCTKDRSVEILQQTIDRFPERKSQVILIQHEHNKGLGGARHTAFAASRGRYIMHVDSDDLLPRGAVEKLVKAAEKSGADIVDGGYADICEGRVLREFKPDKHGKEAYLKMMLCQNVTSNRIWGRIYRRSLYTDNQVLPVEGIDYSEDFCLVTRLMLHARRAWIDDVVYHYRNDNCGSYTHQRSEKNMLSMFRAQALVNNYFREHDTKGTYATALQIGALNACREALRNGFSLERAETLIDYVPRGFVPRLCLGMLRRRWPMPLFRVVYLAWRRLYVTFACRC